MPNSPLRSVSARLAGVVLAASISCAARPAHAQVPPPEANLPVPASPLIPPAFTANQTPTRTAPAPAANVQPGEQVFQVIAPQTKLNLRNLDTRVLELGNRIKVVDGFDQNKLSVKALSPHRVRLHAENPGVTTVKLIDEFDNIHVIDVFVEPDTRELEAFLLRLFPDSAIEVIGIRDGVVLRGWVTEPNQIPQIMAIAEQFYEIVHPQLTVAGATQVQLHVKVMEVQRSKLRELGFNFLMTGQQYYVQQGIGGIAPLQALGPNGYLPFGGPPAPSVLPLALPNSEMQFAITGNNNIFQGFLHALQQESLAKILAEPILVTTSGRPATVHSGGEFPVLVPQSFGNLSIQWKEFGVRLEAVPIVLGEGRLRLDLAPEVSEKDYSTSVSINGLVVPGVTSRSVNTQVEMRFGETLMIGGLISTRSQGTTHKIPFLGELPWIGVAFSRKSYNVGETELVILVTPQLVSPMAPHQVPQGGPGLNSATPIDRELYFDGTLEVPNYGPECPDCEPGHGFGPVSQPCPPGQNCEPTPAYPLLGGKSKSGLEIQQASHSTELMEPGSRTTVVNPFHAAAKAETTAATPPKEKAITPKTGHGQSGFHSGGVQQAAATTESPRNNDSRPRSTIFDARILPGMIQPKSADAGSSETSTKSSSEKNR